MDIDGNAERKLSDGIDHILKIADIELGELYALKKQMPYLGTKHAKRTAFIRALANKFKEYFGQYMYRTIRTVASVVLDDNTITEGNVRDALKASKPKE